MFIWIASYPKSGNTLLRSMIASYFFTRDGSFNFDLIENIKQFPSAELFKKFGHDPSNVDETIKNYIKIQNKINKKDSVQFLKTHSYLFNINNQPFTDLKNSLGAIYVVRDPRNVVTSWANHSSSSIEEAANYLINKLEFSLDGLKIFHGNWGSNYQSWKSFQYQDRYLLVKYEDLISKKKLTFIKILEFIAKLNKTEIFIDHSKIDKIIENTDFKKMKKLENKIGFKESVKYRDTKKKVPFFYKGTENNWKKILDEKIRNKIELAFNKEMKELNYL